MWKVMLLTLLVLNIGIPINTYWQAAALGVCILAVANCDLRTGKRSLLLVAGLFVAFQLLKLLVAAPQWVEGSNLFVPNERNLTAVYRRTLPPLVLETFTAEYARANPRIPCDRAAKLPWESPAPCWEDLAIEQGPFAKSVDGIFQRTAHGRLVRAVDIGAGKPLSAGFLFDWQSVWHTTPENPNKTPLSYYVAEEIVPALEGSSLCWSGSIVWEKRQRVERAASQPFCRPLAANDIGERVWALQANASVPLTLRLLLSSGLKARLYLHYLFMFGSTLLLLMVGLRLQSMRWQPTAIYAASVGLIVAAAPTFLAGLPGDIVNRDALLYLSWGRDITFNMIQGDLRAAVQGGEPIFVFMPGMRYFLAAEFFLFGDSGLGHVVCMSFLPLAIYLIVRELTGKDSVFVVLVIASLTMLVKAFRTAADGYSDPLGFFVIALALLLFLRNADALKSAVATRPNGGIAAGFVLLALSIIVRPNFVLAGMLMPALWLMLQNWRALPTLKATECLGITLVLLVPLHNIVFGHRFVALTLATELPDALTASPVVYARALGELLSFAPAENWGLIARKLASWLLPAKWLLFFGAALVAILPSSSLKLRLVAAIAFALQAPHLFFRSGSREMLAANYLALIAVVVFAWNVVVQYRQRRVFATIGTAKSGFD
jgi:hypothetical protein